MDPREELPRVAQRCQDESDRHFRLAEDARDRAEALEKRARGLRSLEMKHFNASKDLRLKALKLANLPPERCTRPATPEERMKHE
jgi:hypothetical protein